MTVNHIAQMEVRRTIMMQAKSKAEPLSEEAKLIARCVKGERLAQSELYKKWYNQVFAVCLRYANDRDEAKNLVNTTFFKVFKNLHKFEATGAFGGWVRRISINICIDHVRSRNKMIYMEPQELPEATIENDIVSQLSAEDILASLQKVSPVSRMVFSLHVIEGYKHREIAEQLGIKEATSRWHLLNAKKELKELLKNYSV
ncbi:MAG: RNA polymerase sigma factor [Bacteroidota bacterium]